MLRVVSTSQVPHSQSPWGIHPKPTLNEAERDGSRSLSPALAILPHFSPCSGASLCPVHLSFQPCVSPLSLVPSLPSSTQLRGSLPDPALGCQFPESRERRRTRGVICAVPCWEEPCSAARDVCKDTQGKAASPLTS